MIRAREERKKRLKGRKEKGSKLSRGITEKKGKNRGERNHSCRMHTRTRVVSERATPPEIYFGRAQSGSDRRRIFFCLLFSFLDENNSKDFLGISAIGGCINVCPNGSLPRNTPYFFRN